MPRRYCGSCRGDLHADDGHSECVSCLGKAHADAALAGSDCSHCESISLASLRTRIAFFSESDPAPRALPFSSSQGPVRKKQRGRGFQRLVESELTPAQIPRASFSPHRELSPVLFIQPDQRPSASVSDLVSFGGSDDELADDSMSLVASDAEELWGSVTDPAPSGLPAPSAAKAGMDAELFRVLSKAVEELGLEWSPPEEPSRSRLDEWFLPGRRQAPQQRPSPFFPEVHDELTRSWRSPYSARLRTSASSALTTVDGAEEKGYERMPQLDESVAAHLCPPTAIGWKAKASHPSKPCRTTSALAGRSYASAGQAASALHSMAVLQVYQAKLLSAIDESEPDPATLRELRSATDLALRATKTTAQAIGRSMASLVVLERHLWLTLTEIKDADRVSFLDAPISPSGLFGPAVKGFAERFTEAQKASQAMRHFLPKRSSPAAAQSRPRTAPTQQSAKPAPAVYAPQPARTQQPRGRSRSARRHPPPTRQGPRLKIALDPVRPALSESGFYSRYFLVPKKDGGLRPILDLRRLNHALMRRPFRMITLKQILSQICTEDWFCSLDLKDAYFHIQIAPHHRRFLRFAFEGVAYQYTVLPFGLSLAPRTFTRCMDAALSPLRQMGIRILNYLDDWLILAQSEVELLSHRTLILSHLERLGLRVNFAKSALSPSQRISFLGTVLDSAHMRAVIAPERALAIQKLAATFKSDTARPLKVFQRMLGLMAAASPVLQLGLLRMRPLQRWLKPRVPHNAWRHGRLHIRVNQACVTALTPWKNPRWMEKGVAMGLVHTRKVVTTDASNTGWGGAVRRQTDLRPLVEDGERLPHQLLGNASSLSSLPVFPAGPNRTPCADSLRQHVRGVLYKSPGRCLLEAPLYSGRAPSGMGSAQPALAEGSTPAGQTEPRSRYVISEQCPLRGVDAPSAGGSEDLEDLWQGRSRPFRLQRQLSLPNLLFEGQGCVGPRLAQPPPLCIPPDRPASTGRQAYQGTGSQGAIGGPLVEEPTLVVRADSATDSSPLARAPETGSPLSGERNNMAPSTRAVGSLHLAAQWEPTGFPERVLNTISEARAPSTRHLYALKWSVFSTWCLNRGENPSTSELAVVLSFLQELLDKGRSHSTLKVFVAAIAAFHAPIAGQSVGRDNSVVRFLKGARRLNPPRPLTVPTWDLPTVLRALKGPPFEPLQSTDLRSLSLKTALLLALASVKRVGDLQALSTSPACLEFGLNDSKVVLKPRHGYVPKVLSTPFRAQVITLSTLPPSEEDRELSLLCPVRALRIYFERSAPFRHTEQLFVSFGNRTKGHPVTKQRLSKWIVDAVMLAYSSLGLQCPIGVRAHSTRGIASSWAWSSGVSITEICTAAGWATPSTFARFYNLDIPALQARVLSA